MNLLWLLPVVVIAFVAYKLWQQRKKKKELDSAREELERYYRNRLEAPIQPRGRVPTSNRHTSVDTTPARQDDDWGHRHDRKRDDDNSLPWFAAGVLMGDSSSNDSGNSHSQSSSSDNGFHTGGGFGGGDYSSGDSGGSDYSSSSDSGSSDSGGGDSGGGGD